MRKPFICYQGEYFLIDLNLLYESLHLGLEELIKMEKRNSTVENNKIWPKYEKIRAEYLERKSCEYIENLLPEVKIYRNLYYPYAINGKEERCELDALVILDSSLF